MGTFVRAARHEWLERTAALALIFFFVFAAAMTLDLAAAELRRGQVENGLVESGRPETIPTQESLRAAVAANPRDSEAWIALGLAVERRHELEQSARYFAEAEKVDRRYLPAWSSANFHFRHGDAEHFWSAAARASAMIYDDPRPLIDLADRMESDPGIALERLRSTPFLERAYLDFLIGKRRWDAARVVAMRLLARHDTADAGRLRDFADRLRGAGSDLATPVRRRHEEFP